MKLINFEKLEFITKILFPKLFGEGETTKRVFAIGKGIVCLSQNKSLNPTTAESGQNQGAKAREALSMWSCRFDNFQVLKI